MTEVNINTPLKYHMNDLVYYLGMSTGGNLGKQIAYLGAIGAMAKGMLYKINDKEIQDEIDEFVDLVDMLDRAYTPMIDSNQYLFSKARRIRKGVHIAEVLCFHIITKDNLIAGNMMRAKLMEQFRQDQIKGGGMVALG
jgi:hypothetical protein